MFSEFLSAVRASTYESIGHHLQRAGIAHTVAAGGQTRHLVIFIVEVVLANVAARHCFTICLKKRSVSDPFLDKFYLCFGDLDF